MYHLSMVYQRVLCNDSQAQPSNRNSRRDIIGIVRPSRGFGHSRYVYDKVQANEDVDSDSPSPVHNVYGDKRSLNYA